MGLFKVALLVALVLVLESKIGHGAVCKRRSTVLEVRVPQRTNVTIRYPKQIDQVLFAPELNNPNGPQVFKCQNKKCQKCNNCNSNPIPTRSPSTIKTNIVIDFMGSNSASAGQTDNNNKNPGKDGTVIVLEDKTSATSASKSAAQGNQGTSATSASSAAATNTDLIAAFNENNQGNKGSPGNTQDIYVEDASQTLTSASADAANNPKSTAQQPAGPSSTGQAPSSPQSPANQDPNASQAPQASPAAPQESTPKDLSKSAALPGDASKPVDLTPPASENSPAGENAPAAANPPIAGENPTPPAAAEPPVSDD